MTDDQEKKLAQWLAEADKRLDEFMTLPDEMFEKLTLEEIQTLYRRIKATEAEVAWLMTATDRDHERAAIIRKIVELSETLSSTHGLYVFLSIANDGREDIRDAFETVGIYKPDNASKKTTALAFKAACTNLALQLCKKK